MGRGSFPIVETGHLNSARKPGLRTCRKPESPRRTITRFSPTQGTISATVAMATGFKNESSSAAWRSAVNPLRESKACTSLKQRLPRKDFCSDTRNQAGLD